MPSPDPSLSGTYVGDGDAAMKVPPGATAPLGYSNAVQVTLEIEPGTLLVGRDAEALIITRGSRLS